MIMKKFSIYLLGLLAVVACNKGTIAAIYDGPAGCSFACNVSNVEVSSDDDNMIKIPVLRGDFSTRIQDVSFLYDTSGTGTLPDSLWVEKDPSGVFTLSTTRVIFADGAYTTNAIISVSNLDALKPSKKYRMKLILKGDIQEFHNDYTVVTATRKLNFEKYGDCSYFDECLFYNAYDTEIYKAKEGEIYRVMDPYTEGLIKEEYAALGFMGNPPAYVEFYVEENNMIKYEPFCTGMLAPTPKGNFDAYAYYPGDYKWGKDFSEYNVENVKKSAKEFQLYPVYCCPKFQYGYLDEGAYPITITVK